MKLTKNFAEELFLKRNFYQYYHSKCLLSSLNFRESINKYKQIGKKIILLENLSPKNTVKYITKNMLMDNLKVEIDQCWTWNYRMRNFIMIQLNKLTDVNQLQMASDFNPHAFPIKTRMLETSFSLTTNDSNPSPDYQEFAVVKKPLNFQEIREQMSNYELIDHITESYTLNNFDIYLKYFIITQLEDILCQSTFKDFKIYPFGSSLNGLFLIHK